MSGTDWKFEPAADHGMSPAARLSSVHREPGLLSVAAHLSAMAGLRAYLRLYHRFTVQGAEHLPRAAPFVVIANHESHLDALILSAALPFRARASTFPIAAGDVFFESVATSAFASLFVNALPLWRKKATSHAMTDLRERLLAGHSGYVLFPEGARSRDGNLLKFKAGLGLLVAATPIPVVPCYLDGPFEALPAGKILPRPRRITVRVGQPMSMADVPNAREGWEEVARRTREAVERLSSPN